jgi:hypothetical protein
MPTQYTPILKLALPVEGELDGTWGDTVNDNITSMVEQAVAGAATINTWTANVRTLTVADGTTSESRCAALIAQTGAGGTALTAAGQIICPAATKLYVLKNDSAYAVTLKTASGTGIAVPSGTAAFLFCDGTNVQSSQTTLTLPSGTANGVVYLDGSKVATAGAALTFDGSRLTSTTGKFGSGVAANSASLMVNNVANTATGIQLFQDGVESWIMGMPANSTGLAWSASGTERMRLDASGNLGVGTSSPGVRLDVSGADGVRARVVATSGGTSGMVLSSAGNTAYTVKAGNGDNSLRIDQDGTDRLTLASGGNVGIGTTSPSARLQLVAAGDTVLKISPSSSGTARLRLEGTGSGAGAIASASNGLFIATEDAAPMVFSTTNTERMRLDASGNLGIGTSSPASKLDVVGAVRSTNAGNENYFLSDGTNRSSIQQNGTNFYFNVNDGSASSGSFFWRSSNAFTTRMLLDSSGNLGLGVTPSAWSGSKALEVSVLGTAITAFSANNSQFVSNAYFNGTNWIYAATNSANRYQLNSGAFVWDNAVSGTAGTTATFTERMRLDASGNLGIGTASPAARLDLGNTIGQKLLTYGSGNVRYGLSVETSEWRAFAAAAASLTFGHMSTIDGVTFTERMRLDASGNLGIGTSSPSYKLQLAHATAIDTEMGVSNSAGLSRYGTRASGNAFAGAFTAGKSFELWSAASLAATLDASGNLGLGVTPSAWNNKAIDVDSYASFASWNNATGVTNNVWRNSTPNFVYKNTAAAAMYLQTAGQHIFYTAPSGTAGNTFTFTQAMTLDASGNLGLGVVASAWGSGKAIEIGPSATGFLFNDSNNTNLGSNAYFNAGWKYQTSSVGASRYAQSSGGHTWFTAPSGTTGAAITFTQAMTLDANGNLGVGVTPNAWDDGLVAARALQVGSQSPYYVYSDGAITAYTGMNAYYSLAGTPSWKYVSSAHATQYAMTGGQHQWFTAPSGTAGNAITFTQAMTLDANGNLLVGTTSGYRSGRLVVKDVNRTQTSTLANLHVSTTDTQAIDVGGSIGLGGQVDGSNEAPFAYISGRKENGLSGNYAGYFAVSTTEGGAGTNERMRIDSVGNLLVGTTSPIIGAARRGISVLAPTGNFVPAVFSNDAGSNAAVVEMWNKATTTDNVFSYFYTETTATIRGSITYNRAGGLTAYNTTSDCRAKDILGPVASPGATIDALKVYEGQMKGATQSRPMLVAHEAQAVVPYAVTGVKDEVNEDGSPKFQQMDVSSLVPLLIAEIQSLRQRVAQLERV